jgi:DNA-binding MarR family transcriptional regulator
LTTGHDIAMALRAAYWAMHRRSDARLAHAGVTADQFVLLAALAEVPDEDGITQQEVVRRTASDPSTVRAMLVLLEGRGLVARRRHATDGRARSVTLTVRGRRTYDKLVALTEPVRAALLGVVPPAEVTTLVESLRRIRNAMCTPAARGAAARRKTAVSARVNGQDHLDRRSRSNGAARIRPPKEARP